MKTALEEKGTAPQRARRQQILIVDDEPLFVSSVAEGLVSSGGGYDVLTAANGMEAIHLVEQHAVDLVVTDLKMPEVDGFELLRYLMRHHPHIAVLVMTAFGTPAIEEHVRSHGAIGYLEKPIDLQALADRIEHSLSRSSRGHIQGITLFGFLQLLQLEKKTCTLEIRAGTRRGTLFFQAGELVHAEADELTGEPAAYAISGWETPEIDIESTCYVRKRTISAPLTQILLDAARLQDESAQGFDDGEEFGAFFGGDDEQSTQVRPPAAADLAPRLHHESLDRLLERAMQINGALGIAVFDIRTSLCWSQSSALKSIDLHTAAAGSAETLRAEAAIYRRLGLSPEIEEILFTARDQYHLTRISHAHPELLFYLILDREKSNLGMARLELLEIDRNLEPLEEKA